MANQWFRLWHDMPNDPKFRVIARKSKTSISEVLAVYMHMLVNASLSSERGELHNWNSEDIAAALDIEETDVESIRKAMAGKLLENGKILNGWRSRQPDDEGAAERSRLWKLKQKKEQELLRTVENTDKDKDKDKDYKKTIQKNDFQPSGVSSETWKDFCIHRAKKKATITATAMAGIEREAKLAGWSMENTLRECCVRGWIAFKAEWVNKDKSNKKDVKKNVLQG